MVDAVTPVTTATLVTRELTCPYDRTTTTPPSGPDSAPAAPAGSTVTVTLASVAPASASSADSASDVVRWAAFSCLLVPVVLVVFGTSVGGAAVPALGLLAVTAVCRLLLRRSERSGRVRRTAGNAKSHGARQGARTHD